MCVISLRLHVRINATSHFMVTSSLFQILNNKVYAGDKLSGKPLKSMPNPVDNFKEAKTICNKPLNTNYRCKNYFDIPKIPDGREPDVEIQSH